MRYLDPLRKLRVLYVDDAGAGQVELRDWLDALFADVLVAGTMAEALRLTEEVAVQALVSEIRLPDAGSGAGGGELVETLRRRFPGLPVIFVSASTAPEDLLTAIKVNPVDYLTKPLAWSDFKAALQRLVAQLSQGSAEMVSLGNGSFYCPRDGSLISAGQTQCLTRQERRLIETLIARQGQWVHTEQMLQLLYDDPDRASESGLKSLVMRLRRKIGRETIVNGYGLGYRLRTEAEPGST